MNLIFADTKKGTRQDLCCSILASLNLMADAVDHRAGCGGYLWFVYQSELRHHYERAVMDSLRSLGLSIGDISIACETNVDLICKRGHEGFMDVLRKYEEYLALEEE